MPGITKQRKAPKVGGKFVIDCSLPCGDKIMDASIFEKFLLDSIKVNGKKGQLGQTGCPVKLTRDNFKIHVEATQAFSKRYLKYLTKKFLKKQNLRDWMRVVAVDKNTYDLRYYNISDNDDEDNSDGDE